MPQIEVRFIANGKIIGTATKEDPKLIARRALSLAKRIQARVHAEQWRTTLTASPDGSLTYPET